MLTCVSFGFSGRPRKEEDDDVSATPDLLLPPESTSSSNTSGGPVHQEGADPSNYLSAELTITRKMVQANAPPTHAVVPGARTSRRIPLRVLSSLW